MESAGEAGILSTARRIIFRIVLIAAGVGIGLLAGEAVVRVLAIAPEVAPVSRGRFRLSSDPVLGFEPVPDLSHQGDELFFEYSGTSNHVGFRDRDHLPAKPAGVYRIAVLGDSIAAGWGIADFADTLPALLESGLRRDGRSVEVLSFAVTGYNSQQEVEIFRRRGLDFAPDLVLVAFCLNDVKPPDARILSALDAEASREGVVPRALERGLADWSALYRWLRYRVFAPAADEKAKAAPAPEEAAVVGDPVGTAFTTLDRLAREHGFAVAVVVFPYLKSLERYPEAKARIHRRVERLCAAHGFLYLDLLETFRRCRDRGDLALDRYHPTVLGQRCAAERTVAFLEGTVLAPSPMVAGR